MVLPTLSYEDIVNEVWNKHGQLRDKKKKLRLHAIEELAAHKLTVLPVVTSPCLLSPASSRKALFLVICPFLQIWQLKGIFFLSNLIKN